ncbi:MAG: hypothetical protein KDD44_02645, partial [Bdellovibrionales bacterium]|nr:hypothetical protein [Bdellovibrionales bacterium]
MIALILLTLITFSLMLTDSLRSRAVRAIAQGKADELCAFAKPQLPDIRGALNSISAQLQSPVEPYGFTRLSSVRIVAPTSYYNLSNPAPFLPAGLSGPQAFATLGVPACDPSINCDFVADFTDGSISGNYPSTNFWGLQPSGDFDHNSYISCEVTFDYDILFDLSALGLSRSVTGKSTFRTDVRGATPGSDGSVLVGIAPYVEMYPWESRFRFPDPSASFDPMNPIKGVDHSPAPTAGNLAFTQPRQSFNDSIHPKAFADQAIPVPSDFRYDPSFTANAVPPCASNWIPWNDPESCSALPNYSSRDELLLQKYNLFVAARNKLLSGLEEILMRHGDSRQHGLAIITPKNAGGAPNLPVFISRPNDDPAQRLFTFPFLTWNAGGAFGQICPFEQSSSGVCSPNDLENAYHMLIASTFRDAFFVGNVLNGIVPSQSTVINNVGLEDPLWSSRTVVAPSYPSTAPYGQYWGPSDSSHLMSVAELLQFLPGAEQCPYQAGAPLPNCIKPPIEHDGGGAPTAGAAANGLTGDIVSFLLAARNSINVLSASQPHVPPDASPSPLPGTRNELVLIFTHKRLQRSNEPAPAAGAPCADPPAAPSAEMTAIRQQVSFINSGVNGRNVVVLFMPPNNVGMNEAIRCDFEWAFDAIRD